MNSSNLGSRRYDNGECLSPQSPVSQTYMEPLLPLPPFDLSILKVARAGTALRKMVMNESAIKTKGKKKVSGKSGGQTKMQRQGQDLVPGQRQEQGQQQDHRRERKSTEPSLWSKFAREVTSGIATENSSEDLSDF